MLRNTVVPGMPRDEQNTRRPMSTLFLGRVCLEQGRVRCLGGGRRASSFAYTVILSTSMNTSDMSCMYSTSVPAADPAPVLEIFLAFPCFIVLIMFWVPLESLLHGALLLDRLH